MRNIIKTKVTYSFILFISLSAVACGGGSSSDDNSEVSLDSSTPATSRLGVPIRECDNPDPSWIFCDDFETDAPLVMEGRYFEAFGNPPVESGVGLDGSRALAGNFRQGEAQAGDVKLGFGRAADSYMDQGIQSDRNFREIYYRHLIRFEEGWTGPAFKLSRATILAKADWSQAMIAHLWNNGDDDLLLMDPVNCVSGTEVRCSGYNDFSNFDWLGINRGFSPIHHSSFSNQWLCIEARVRLNDPEQSNGIQQFWVDGVLEASGTNYDFVGDYTEFGINTIFFENFWNGGATRDQSRYFDNIVVSTKRIGCG